MPSLSRVLLRLGRELGALIAPPSCAACDAPLELGRVFCASCGEPPPAQAAASGSLLVHAVAAYRPPLSTAIRRMKFQARPDLARSLAGLFDTAWGLTPSFVVPVPLHPLRLAERGFNPAALLARTLARRTGARFAPTALERVRHTPQQSRSTRAQRQSNVAGAFVARRAFDGATVLLVDDVVTTGATLGACARALEDAGASAVYGAALARA